MPEKSGTDAPRGAADAGAAATAVSAAAMRGICLSFIAAPHHVRKTMLHRSGRAFTWCSTDKVGSPKRAFVLEPRTTIPVLFRTPPILSRDFLASQKSGFAANGTSASLPGYHWMFSAQGR